MKNLITLCLLCFSTLTFSQNNASIDLVGGVEFGYRSLSGDHSDDVPVGLILETRERETGKFGFRFGFNYNQRLSKKIFLKTGLRVANLGYTSGKITGLRWGSEIQNAIDNGLTEIVPDPSLPREVQFFYEYWFLEIPIIGRYEFNEKRWSPFVEVGLSPNIYLDARTKQKTDLGDAKYNHVEVGDAFNKFQLVGSASFGVNFAATESFRIFAQSVFRYHLTKTVDSAVKEHLYNVGLEVGVRKHL